MSIILDALKKSESDQQRQTGPALFEVKVAPPKPRFPMWAVAIAALLGINLIIVAWLLLRPGHGDSARQGTTASSGMPTPVTPLSNAGPNTPNLSQAQWSSEGRGFNGGQNGDQGGAGGNYQDGNGGPGARGQGGVGGNSNFNGGAGYNNGQGNGQSAGGNYQDGNGGPG